MKHFFYLLMTVFAVGLFSSCGSSDNVNVNINVADDAPVASEGFKLEQFHRLLIEEGENETQWDAQFLSDLVNREDINNLDLNNNGTVDTILVEPFDGGDSKGFELYVKVVNAPGTENDQEQSIATITVTKEGDTGSITTSGNPQVYGNTHHYHNNGVGSFFMMYWLFSPRMMYGSAYRGAYRSSYAPRRRASTSAYNSRVNNRNNSHAGRKAGASTRPASGVANASKQRTAAKGVKSKLSNPTASQRSFQAQNRAKSASSGFGKKATGKSSRSSSGRARARGGK